MSGTLRLTARGRNFEDAAKRVRAIGAWSRTGLEGFFLCTSLLRAPRNLAPNKPDATVVGSPGEGAGYVSVQSQVKYLQTQVAEYNEMTIVAVARAAAWGPSPAVAPIVSNNPSSALSDPTRAMPVALSLYGTGSNSVGFIAAHRESGVDYTAGAGVIAAQNTWLCLIGRKYNDKTKLKNMTSGVEDVSATTTHPRDLGLNRMQIGSMYGFFTGGCDVAAVAMFSRAIVDSEMTPLYSQMKGILSPYSIVP